MIKTTDNGVFSICIGTQYSFQCGRIGYQSKFLITLVDPLTPRAFYQRMHFFGNLDFSTLDMSQISYLFRKAFATWHRAFLSTYIVFMTLGMHRNQNFEFLDEKVTYILGLFVFFLILIAFAVSPLIFFSIEINLLLGLLRIQNLLRMHHRYREVFAMD